AEVVAYVVVVEADAFKETYVIYQALSSKGHHNDMFKAAELVHQTAIDATSSLLVTTLNDCRYVFMDETLSREPFVEQTIEMARSIHKHRYRMGVGYKVSDDGTIPEMLNVVCDPYLAVTRGISEDAFTEMMEVLAHSDRILVLLFMGDGMGAGESTVLKEVLKEYVTAALLIFISF
nr:putative zeta toxin domain, P-loop containing nucleoside triphosphate hydrolase [Tanacetum cinerariifolium]